MKLGLEEGHLYNPGWKIATGSNLAWATLYIQSQSELQSETLFFFFFLKWANCDLSSVDQNEIKYLPHKSDNLNLIPRTNVENSDVVLCVSVIPTL